MTRPNPTIAPFFAVVAALMVAYGSASATAATPDWWETAGPTMGAPAVFGTYNRGCVAGTTALPADGPGFQVMRPSRDRFYGHPKLVALVQDLALAMQARGTPGILVGDLAQPRGGPMRSGHASHQIGLDADIWFQSAPARRLSNDERETMSATTMVRKDGLWVNDHWTADQLAALRWSAERPEVARIFVNAAIKLAACQQAEGDRTWLRKVRPWWGHHYHFHIRLRCPASDTACKDQAPPPPGDGCDAALDWWFSEEATAKPTTPPKPRRRLTLAELPAQCERVLTAP